MAQPPHFVDLAPYLKPKETPQLPVINQRDWLKDSAQTAVFRELQTRESLGVGEGVEVIPLNHDILEGDSTSFATHHLVTRLEQRKVIDYAVEQSRMNLDKRNYVVALRGSPGIGKSRSALLYIRKLMLQTESSFRRPILF